MKHITLFLFISVFLLTACGGQQAAEPTAEIAAPLMEDATPELAVQTAAPLPTETTAPPTDVPTEAPTAMPVDEPTARPPAAPDPTATVETAVEVEEPAPMPVISGKTAEGAFFYGNPDAPVTLFDYSDFL